MDDPIAPCRLIPMHQVVLANSGCAPDEEPNLSHGSRYQRNHKFEESTVSKKGSIKTKLTEILEDGRKYLLVLATLATTITYQVGLAPLGGIWQDNSHGHKSGDPVLRSSYPRWYKAFFYCNAMAFVASTLAVLILNNTFFAVLILNNSKHHISREGSNKQRLGDTPAVKEQRRPHHQMEKFRALLRHMARILAKTRPTLVPSDCFIVTLSLQMVHFAYSLHQDVLRSRKRFTCTVGIALLCTLQNVFRAIGIPPKAQQAVSRDSESTSKGNFRENEHENSRDQRNHKFEESTMSKEGSIKTELTEILEDRPKYLLMLAILAATITYQVGLDPPGGFWQDISHGHVAGDPVLTSSYPRRYKAFFYCNAMAFVAFKVLILLKIKHHISREGSNKQRLGDAPAVKEQGRRHHQMEKLRALLRQVARILAKTRPTLAPSDCFIVTLSLQMVCFAYSLHQDVLRTQKRFTYTVGIALLCTLQNVFKAIGIPPKAQQGVSRDSESTSTGNFRETEQENSSGSYPRVAKHDVINAVAKTAATWLVASAATHHATGNRELLSGFKTLDGISIQAGDGVPMPARGRGSVITDTVVLLDVMFVPGLTQNIVSASQLIELDYTVGFTRGVCYIRGAADGTVIGKALVGEDGMFQLEFLKVPLVN